jgi:membrane-associated phospholipid phosphatase
MLGAVRSSEWIALSYFAYLGVVCWLRPVARSRRLLLTGVSAALVVTIRSVAAAAPETVRNWAPFAYVTVAYYMTGRLFVHHSAPLENWLIEWDRRLLGNPTTRFAGWPRWVVTYLEIVYMLCFLLLPAGLAALVLSGHARLANHYWSYVLAADLGAFAPLSVFQTRPPWMVEPRPGLSAPGMHNLASRVVENLTIRVNTFPSGHVAVSFAVAAGVFTALPAMGVLFFVLSCSIAVACVVGRYHYFMDVLTGALLALIVVGVMTAAGI